MADAPFVVRYHYLKSKAHRVVHVDGAFGGPTPTGLVHASLYSERFPIPAVAEHEATVQDGGSALVGTEKRMIGGEADGEPNGIVREVEVGVVMTLEAARKLRSWLDEMIKKIEEAKPRNEAATPSNEAGGANAG